jgi:hypothetical protein
MVGWESKKILLQDMPENRESQGRCVINASCKTVALYVNFTR